MRTLLLSTITALALAGCQGPPVRTPPEQAKALALVADGRYQEAADEYVALSRSARGAVAQELMLEAVTLLLRIGRTERASDLMGELEGRTIAAGLAPRYDLRAADLALQRGAPERTLELLPAPAAERFGDESRPEFHLLRARAYEDVGRFFEAARERGRYERLAYAGRRRQDYPLVARLQPLVYLGHEALLHRARLVLGGEMLLYSQRHRPSGARLSFFAVR